MNALWLRNDLRTQDNTALEHLQAPMLVVFVVTKETWQRHHYSPQKIALILHRLNALSDHLAKRNIPLKIIDANSFSQTPKTLLTFCQQHQVTQLHANREYLVDEMARDQDCQRLFTEYNITLTLHDDSILAPEDLVKTDDTPYKVFTPFKKQWLNKAVDFYTNNRQPKKQAELPIKPDRLSLKIKSPIPATTPPLTFFITNQVHNYKITRDFPARNQTSHLSAYFSIGALSARQAITALLEHYGAQYLSELPSGPTTWLSELIWREFYRTICFHFPSIVKGRAFKPNTDRLPWSTNESHFNAWCEGQTGFPFVDAGMRQLNQTGWMHNRLRMVTAMFLTKTLFINWRWGEQYFMTHLVDGDFAANNGGWQWSASTGTDSAPYFRIFNPTTQGKRFDQSGDFIRQYCPELRSLSSKEIHNPSPLTRQACGYPEPIVDYKIMRERVIQAFKNNT